MSDNEENINSNLDATTSIVDDIVNGELADAQNAIKGILSQNMADEIEGHKQEFAATLFQDEPEVEEISVSYTHLTLPTNSRV